MTNHTATLTETTQSGTRVVRVVDTGGNTSGAPTLAAYLAAELTSGFVEASRGKDFVITVSASDLNAA